MLWLWLALFPASSVWQIILQGKVQGSDCCTSYSKMFVGLNSLKMRWTTAGWLTALLYFCAKINQFLKLKLIQYLLFCSYILAMHKNSSIKLLQKQGIIKQCIVYYFIGFLLAPVNQDYFFLNIFPPFSNKKKSLLVTSYCSGIKMNFIFFSYSLNRFLSQCPET